MSDGFVVLTLEVPLGLTEIIDHLATTLGITREEAAMHFLRADAIQWYAQVMRRDRGDT